MFFCFLLKEARHLLKKLLSVLNLLVKGSRSCNYNTALMTVSGLIFCFIAAWGIEEGFFLYYFCPIVSLLLSVLLRPQPDVTFISAVALFAAASAQIYVWSLTQYILWVVSSRFLVLQDVLWAGLAKKMFKPSSMKRENRLFELCLPRII